MSDRQILRGSFWLMAASALCFAGIWLYGQRVLVAYQVSDAALSGRPRGNLSDLYPRWVGARELLLHGRDPYSAGVTREVQAGYYGRPLDASRPGDPKDQQAFAYPVYVAFYLAPTVRLPFDVVRRGFFWFLLVLTLLSIPIWMRVANWRPHWSTQLAVVTFTIGSLVVLQGLTLQQMTLLVAALVAIAIILLTRDRGVEAGILLALATIKPQLVFGLLLWLAIWTASDWKQRYRWLMSFLTTLIVLCVAGELYLPHWIARFWRAVHEYQAYTDAVPLLGKLIPAPWSGIAVLGAGIAMLLAAWKYRKSVPSSAAFALTTSLVLALTLLVIPTYALYNQVLLLPALLWIARDWRTLWNGNRVSRFLVAAVAVLLFWPYFSGTILAGLSFFLSPERVQRAWAVPGWTALTLPVAVAALMLVVAYRGSFPNSRKPIPA